MPNTVPLVLDVDIDVFVTPIHRYARDSDPRLSSEHYQVKPLDAVTAFARHNCRLGRTKIPGMPFVFHTEIFAVFQRLIAAGRLAVPFHLVHVDAHDDLDPETPLRVQVDSGNWVRHVVEQQWLTELTIVNRTESDNPPELFMNWNSYPFRLTIGNKPPIHFYTLEEFRASSVPSYLFVTQSPAFTPATADQTFEYFRGFIGPL